MTLWLVSILIVGGTLGLVIFVTVVEVFIRILLPDEREK